MDDFPIKQYFLNVRPEMAAFLPNQFSTTLEIGCGAGGFTSTYLREARERWGVEPDADAAHVAAPKFNQMLVGTYDQITQKLPNKHFDLVICNDVIEHMPDHDRFLQDVATKMRPGGHIVGSVPNIRHFTALVKLLIFKDFPYAEDGILDRTHKRFFTIKSLRRTFRENSYEVEALNGIRSIIRDGITGLPPAKKAASKIAAAVLVGASFGYWSDTQYSQIAFRVRRA
jgi:2-polyprenyl-3-methyl-5-hydroxy-6-metoxy-1,4-benzoquinol methylase